MKSINLTLEDDTNLYVFLTESKSISLTLRRSIVCNLIDWKYDLISLCTVTCQFSFFYNLC